MSDPLTQTSRGWFRRSVRFVRWLVVLAVVAFAGMTLATSFHYGVSLGTAARGLLHQGGLAVIRAGVAIYDPTRPRLARIGPDGEGEFGGDYDRVETVLEPGRSLTLAAGTKLTAEAIRNERIVHSRFAYRYQPFDEPRLQELNHKYRLGELVAAAPSEFEGMVRLRGWCRDQFRRAEFQPDPINFDTLEILDRDRHSETAYSAAHHCDPCKFFPLLYVQAMLSVGHQARYVATEHGMTEVWSNQFRKWVLMDAELDHHFVKAGVPLSAGELRDEYVADPSASSVLLVRGPIEERRENPTMAHLRVDHLTSAIVLPWFNDHITLVSLRNDFLTNHYFRGHPDRSESRSLLYLHPDPAKPVKFDQRLRQRTHDPDDFYWTLNQTEIYARPGVTESLPLAFRTVTPNFARYEIAIDEAAPVSVELPMFDWKLHPGANSLSVRSINQFGVRGIESSVRVRVTGGEIDRSPAATTRHAGSANARSSHP
jgi:hypothetical protein